MMQDDTPERELDKLSNIDNFEGQEDPPDILPKDKIKSQHKVRRHIEDFFEAKRLHELLDDDAALDLEDRKERKDSLTKIIQHFQGEKPNE